MDHYILENLGIIIVLAFAAQWIGWKLRVPVIVLLLIFGIFSGPVFNLIQPKLVFGELLPPFIELAVAIILFEGGMSLKWHEFRQSSKGLIRLFSVAVVTSWLLGSILGHYLANISWPVSLLISGILIVTGPTVIIPALREAKLTKKTSNYLKWEGIINDPIGAIIAVLVLQFQLFQESDFIFFAILKIISISTFIAWLTRHLLLKASQKALFPEFLKVPFFIGLVLILFIFSELLQKGSGLLTSTLLGLFIGNINISSVKDLRRFGESLTIFTVSIIFIILSAGLELSVWKELSINHYILITLFAFVIRPISIYLSTFKSGISNRERILIGMYGPRGIVAASVAGVSSEILLQQDVKHANLIVPMVFSVILLTVVIHGLWLKPLARKLKLTNVGENGVVIVGANQWSIQLAKKLKSINLPVMVTDTSWYQLAQARLEGVETHYGQILQDREFGEPDLSEYNYLLAFTEDDSYNSLLCDRFGHELGHDHVYKLPVIDSEYRNSHKLSKKEFCTLTESNLPLYENLMQKGHHGWKFKVKKFEHENSYKDFDVKQWGESIIPMLVIRSNKRVELFSNETYRLPIEGDLLVYYEQNKRKTE